MKNLYILFLFVLLINLPLVSSCQTYSIFPNDTIELTANLEDFNDLMIYQENLTQDSIVLQWSKVSESVPQAWDSYVCDNLLCYGGLEPSGTMNPVGPGDMAFLLVHLTAHVVYGTGTVQYAVWDSNFPAIKDTLTFILHVYDPLGVPENDAVSFNAYLSSQNSISITTNSDKGFHYIISDINGKRILEGESAENNISLPVGTPGKGIYFVTVNNITKKIFIGTSF
jgi:hypothetical protein